MSFATPLAFFLLLLLAVVLILHFWQRRKKEATLQYSSLLELKNIQQTLRARHFPVL